MADSVDVVASAPSSKPARTDVLAEMPWEPLAPKSDEPAADSTDEAKPDVPVEDAPLKDDEAELAKVETKESDPADPDAKRLTSIAKAEKRSRDLISKERADAKADFQAEVERVRAEITPHIDSVKKYKAAVEQARTNPVELMRSLGLSEDDFEYVAQQLFNSSKAAASDPKRASAAAHARREREKDLEIRELRDWRTQVETEKKQAAATQTFEQQKTQFLDHVTATLPAEAPLLKAMIEKNPTKAKAEMWKTTERLFAETGEVPDAEDVALEYEKQRRSELEELGIDPATIISKAKSPVIATDTKRPAKTLDATATSTTPVPKPGVKKSAAEVRAELLKSMPWETGTA